MSYLSIFAKITPIARHAYVDRVRVWLPLPLSSAKLAWLREHCGDVLLFEEQAKFALEYRYRYEIIRPSFETIQSLATLPKAHLNRVEEALDLIFVSEEERDAAQELINRHSVVPYHRTSHGTNYCKGTRYSAHAKVKRKLVIYPEPHSRATGELYCLHIEWRMEGIAALRREKINALRDLLDLDRHTFWLKHLILMRVDFRALGRMHSYKEKGSKRREWIIIKGRFSYDIHRRIGSTMCRYRDVQDLLDMYRTKLPVRSALSRCWIPQLLPAQSRGW